MIELTKEKQIEEMADLIWNDTNCSEQAAIRSAEVLYNFGYCKVANIFKEIERILESKYSDSRGMYDPSIGYAIDELRDKYIRRDL